MRQDLVKLAAEVKAAYDKEMGREDADPDKLEDLKEVLEELDMAGSDTAVVEVRGGCIQEAYASSVLVVVDWDNLTGGR